MLSTSQVKSVPVHDMKVHRMVEVWCYSILTSALYGGGQPPQNPEALPPGKERTGQFKRRLGGPQSQSGHSICGSPAHSLVSTLTIQSWHQLTRYNQTVSELAARKYKCHLVHNSCDWTCHNTFCWTICYSFWNHRACHWGATHHERNTS